MDSNDKFHTEEEKSQTEQLTYNRNNFLESHTIT